MTTQLTERERRVISLAAEGFTRQEIGELLAATVEHGGSTSRGVSLPDGVSHMQSSVQSLSKGESQK